MKATPSLPLASRTPRDPSPYHFLDEVSAAVRHGETQARIRRLSDRLFALAKSLCDLRDSFGPEAVCSALRELRLVEPPDLPRFEVKLLEASPWGTDKSRCQARQARARARLAPHRFGPVLADGRREGVRAVAAYFEILAWSADGTVEVSVSALADLFYVEERTVKRYRRLLVEIGLIEPLESLGAHGTARYRWSPAQVSAPRGPGGVSDTPSPAFPSPESDTPLPLIEERIGLEQTAAADPRKDHQRDPNPSQPSATNSEISFPTLSGQFTVTDNLLARWKAKFADRDVPAILEVARSKASREPVRDGRAWCLAFLRNDHQHLLQEQKLLHFPIQAAPQPNFSETERDVAVRSERLRSLSETQESVELAETLSGLDELVLAPEKHLAILEELEAWVCSGHQLSSSCVEHVEAARELVSERNRLGRIRTRLRRLLRECVADRPGEFEATRQALRELERLEDEEGVARALSRGGEMLQELGLREDS